MSKTILGNVEGWTPVIDTIVDELGVMSAVVFGKAWRYCQMIDGVCKASQDRLAQELGLSRATINSHLAKLTESGYLEDMTPNLLGLPHQYRDTGKANLSINLTATCQKSLQPPVKNFDTKKVVKETSKEINVNEEKRAKILKSLYQENIGAVVPMLLDEFREAAKFYPDSSWYKDAFEIAVKNNARNWSYVCKVLENWRKNGRQWSPIVDKQQGKPKATNQPTTSREALKERIFNGV
jgi:DnaD/phage-associated family protein